MRCHLYQRMPALRGGPPAAQARPLPRGGRRCAQCTSTMAEWPRPRPSAPEYLLGQRCVTVGWPGRQGLAQRGIGLLQTLQSERYAGVLSNRALYFPTRGRVEFAVKVRTQDFVIHHFQRSFCVPALIPISNHSEAPRRSPRGPGPIGSLPCLLARRELLRPLCMKAPPEPPKSELRVDLQATWQKPSWPNADHRAPRRRRGRPHMVVQAPPHPPPSS